MTGNRNSNSPANRQRVRPTFTLGERALVLRRRLGWSQTRLAEVLGISRRTVCNLERVPDWQLTRDTVLRFRILERRHIKPSRGSNSNSNSPGTSKGH